MNEELNKLGLIISHITLCILICLDKIFQIIIVNQIYLITIMVSIVSLGNLIVAKIQRRKKS